MVLLRYEPKIKTVTLLLYFVDVSLYLKPYKLPNIYNDLRLLPKINVMGKLTLYFDLETP